MLSVPTLWLAFAVNFLALGLVWSYVIRSYTPDVRAAVWSDLQKVMVELGMPLPKRAASSS